METEKMTLKEAQDYVRNTKYIVWSEDESEQLQKKLFEIGCKWMHSGKSICNTTETFLLVDNNLNVRYDIKECYKYFEKSTNRYEQAENIISIEIEQEQPKQPTPKFDPKTLEVYDKVLVRESQKQVWRAKFFHCKKCGQFYMIDDSMYNCCIPFNDETKHLHGTREEEPDFYKQN